MTDEFKVDEIAELSRHWVEAIISAYKHERPMPKTGLQLPKISAKGSGTDSLPNLWQMIVDGSAHLATPQMSGHMDTAPHPIAAMTNGLVSALNNNMLFRELSPVASDIEETMISLFTDRLNLSENWRGTFASGGSIANLTALFAAVGGFKEIDSRENVHLLIPASAHLSLAKSAKILGIGESRIHRIDCDDAGRMDIDSLSSALQSLPKAARPIVTCVIGTTIHGSVDNFPGVRDLCRQYPAWLHVDLIYGAGVMFSDTHNSILDELDGADSIVLGPQKWMFVPRVSAVVLIHGIERFDEALGVNLPYSLSGEQHRGRWGIQGSRPADAVVLWTMLQVIGTDTIGRWVDQSIDITQKFHGALLESKLLQPTHQPDLNLQTFRIGEPDIAGERLAEVHRRLTQQGRCWFSLSRWRDESLIRAVFLSPEISEQHISSFIADIENVI